MDRSKSDMEQLVAMTENIKQIHHLTAKHYDSLEILIADYLLVGREIFQMQTGIVSHIIEGKRYIVKDVITDLDVINEGDEYELEGTYCREVYDSKATLGFPHVGEIAELKDHPVYVNLKLEAYLSAPIFVNEELYGTLNFTSLIPRQHGFSEHEHDLISMMAVSIGNFILLQSKENTLKKTNLRIKELVGYLSHDLRGPLGSINGLCKVALTHTMTNDKKTQIFETIQQESEKSLELVNTILDQAALGTGKIDLHKEYFTAEDFIQNALRTFSLLIKEKELNVKTSIPLALELFADRPRLLQAVNNLLVNAFKYAQKGSDIDISFIEKEEHTTCTISNLKDNKANTANETIYKSIGYGLDIVHDILKLHGTKLKLNEENNRYIVSFDLAIVSKNL